MKKKLFILLFLMFFVTGCSIDYNVEIYNDVINEKINLTYVGSNSAQETKEKIENVFLKYFDSTDMLYMRKFETFEDKQKQYYAFKEESSYSFENYQQELAFIRSCCRSIELSNDGNYINFRTLGYFRWFEKYEELDSLKISVKSNHKVKEHNADHVNRYEYVWNIDRYNYKDKIPSLKLYSNKYVFDYEGKYGKKIIYFILFTVIIVSGIGLIYLYFNYKNKKANEI